jgi:hypothetical protein
MVALVLLLLLLAAGLAAALGRSPDTRDPDFGIGRVCRPATPPEVERILRSGIRPHG